MVVVVVVAITLRCAIGQVALLSSVPLCTRRLRGPPIPTACPQPGPACLHLYARTHMYILMHSVVQACCARACAVLISQCRPGMRSSQAHVQWRTRGSKGSAAHVQAGQLRNRQLPAKASRGGKCQIDNTTPSPPSTSGTSNYCASHGIDIEDAAGTRARPQHHTNNIGAGASGRKQ